MKKRWPALAGAVLCFGLLAPLGAEEPAHVTYAPAPPGTLMQNQLVYLTGEAMHSQWRAVASKQLIGQGNGTSFYQWYLSLYAIDGATYRLKYQSPANGGPLSKVTQASDGAKMWFPVQTLQIAGVGEFEKAGVQQLVVSSHEMAADCGSATVTVLASGANGAVVPAVSVRNGCSLKATIAHAKNARSARRDRSERPLLQLDGADVLSDEAEGRGRAQLSQRQVDANAQVLPVFTPANFHRNVDP